MMDLDRQTNLIKWLYALDQTPPDSFDPSYKIGTFEGHQKTLFLMLTRPKKSRVSYDPMSDSMH